MPFQFPISRVYSFEKDKGIGFGSFYYGCAPPLFISIKISNSSPWPQN
jgi:hypothetical protein